MPNQNSTRELITIVADSLFYQRGFENTSFADIAEEVKISRGNFYHHFKTKDEILSAVIDLRIEKTGNLLNKWHAESKNAKESIKSFINILIMNMSKIKLYGCPVGTLCTELAKLNHPYQKDARKLFNLFREWLKDRFIELGHKSTADKLAMHLLAQTQGVATLAASYHDEDFIHREVKLMNKWLDEI